MQRRALGRSGSGVVNTKFIDDSAAEAAGPGDIGALAQKCTIRQSMESANGKGRPSQTSWRLPSGCKGVITSGAGHRVASWRPDFRGENSSTNAADAGLLPGDRGNILLRVSRGTYRTPFPRAERTHPGVDERAVYRSHSPCARGAAVSGDSRSA